LLFLTDCRIVGYQPLTPQKYIVIAAETNSEIGDVSKCAVV